MIFKWPDAFIWRIFFKSTHLQYWSIYVELNIALSFLGSFLCHKWDCGLIEFHSSNVFFMNLYFESELENSPGSCPKVSHVLKTYVVRLDQNERVRCLVRPPATYVPSTVLATVSFGKETSCLSQTHSQTSNSQPVQYLQRWWRSLISMFVS